MAMAVDDGDLDTFTSGRAREDHEDEDGVDGPPPAKRRRLGNIGDSMSSVFETAVSAALIGAAVGVAAYRIWTNRGKSITPASTSVGPENVPQVPPPPYHPGDWGFQSESSASQSTPRRSRRPSRQAHTVGHTSASRRKIVTVFPSPRTPPPPSLRSPTRDRLLHSPVSEAGSDASEFGEHADWMGSQLSRLIQEGQRALGRDIVLPTDPDVPDADEDMQDDMGWVDEERRRVRSVSVSHRRSRSSLGAPRSPMSASWTADTSVNPTFLSPRSAPREEDDVFLSEELREAMANARAARGL